LRTTAEAIAQTLPSDSATNAVLTFTFNNDFTAIFSSLNLNNDIIAIFEDIKIASYTLTYT
jgi:hypothetical protein